MWHLEVKATVFMTVVLLCDVSYACGRAKYKIGEECCPMCASGTRVYKHCSEYTSTSCIPCTGETFIDQPNGRSECFRCAVCDQGLGLTIHKVCTPISNTVCGPLDQHFCTLQDSKGSCRKAERHTVCKPGQFIKQKGTTSTDTKCGDCPDKTFSDGLSTYCKPHRDCKSEGLIESKPGSHSSDSECGEKFITGLILGFSLGIFVLVVAGEIFFVQRRRQPNKVRVPSAVGPYLQ